MEYVFENLLDEIVNSRIDGIVCSGKELPIVKNKYPDLITVVPGIRMPNDPKDDQSRTVTPREAVDAGAEYLVIGRSVTKAKSPSDAVKRVLDSL